VEEEAKEFTQHKLNSAEIAKFDRLSQMTAKLQTAVKAEASAMKVSPGRINVPPALHMHIPAASMCPPCTAPSGPPVHSRTELAPCPIAPSIRPDRSGVPRPCRPPSSSSSK
jgi:hypothetical protein